LRAVTTAPAKQPSYRDGMRAALPLAVAVLGFGLSFGVLARAEGFGSLAPIVMSVTTFAGSAQFAAVSVLGAGGSVAAAVLAATLLNSRYITLGISVSPELRGSLPRRLLEAQLVVDESWAIGHQGGGRFNRRMLLGAGLVLYLAWVGGTVIGVLGGDALGDPADFGLDAAFPALFLGLLVRQVNSRPALAAALLGGAIAIVLVPIVPPGVPIIAASLACLIGLRRT
jgi:4-azaleucine resistance transporter AzlC